MKSRILVFFFNQYRLEEINEEVFEKASDQERKGRKIGMMTVPSTSKHLAFFTRLLDKKTKNKHVLELCWYNKDMWTTVGLPDKIVTHLNLQGGTSTLEREMANYPILFAVETFEKLLLRRFSKKEGEIHVKTWHGKPDPETLSFYKKNRIVETEPGTELPPLVLSATPSLSSPATGSAGSSPSKSPVTSSSGVSKKPSVNVQVPRTLEGHGILKQLESYNQSGDKPTPFRTLKPKPSIAKLKKSSTGKVEKPKPNTDIGEHHVKNSKERMPDPGNEADDFEDRLEIDEAGIDTDKDCRKRASSVDITPEPTKRKRLDERKEREEDSSIRPETEAGSHQSMGSISLEQMSEDQSVLDGFSSTSSESGEDSYNLKESVVSVSQSPLSSKDSPDRSEIELQDDLAQNIKTEQSKELSSAAELIVTDVRSMGANSDMMEVTDDEEDDALPPGMENVRLNLVVGELVKLENPSSPTPPSIEWKEARVEIRIRERNLAEEARRKTYNHGLVEFETLSQVLNNPADYLEPSPEVEYEQMLDKISQTATGDASGVALSREKEGFSCYRCKTDHETEGQDQAKMFPSLEALHLHDFLIHLGGQTAVHAEGRINEMKVENSSHFTDVDLEISKQLPKLSLFFGQTDDLNNCPYLNITKKTADEDTAAIDINSPSRDVASEQNVSSENIVDHDDAISENIDPAINRVENSEVIDDESSALMNPKENGKNTTVTTTVTSPDGASGDDSASLGNDLYPSDHDGFVCEECDEEVFRSNEDFDAHLDETFHAMSKYMTYKEYKISKLKKSSKK